MAMPADAIVWTPEMVLALPEDGKRYECIDGELLVTPAPRPAHQLCLKELSRVLDPYIRGRGLGLLIDREADIRLEPTSLVVPDLIVVPPTVRLPIRRWEDVTALLLAVEILSPSTAYRDRGIKRRYYQRVGVPQYWIVDLDARLVERWRPEDERPEVLREQLLWQPNPETSPLVIELAPLFDEVERWTGTPGE